jgi:endonuclease YncB( thermonuclease family)
MLGLILLVADCAAADLEGQVVRVADGDTFTLLNPARQQIQIRLAEIDASESGQPYGNKSRQILASLIAGKQIRIVVQTKDRYGRTVGRPYVGESGKIS